MNEMSSRDARDQRFRSRSLLQASPSTFLMLSGGGGEKPSQNISKATSRVPQPGGDFKTTIPEVTKRNSKANSVSVQAVRTEYNSQDS